VYPEGYGLLLDRATQLFQADPRVRGMWLHGALARGAADSGSDLDIDIAVAVDNLGPLVRRSPGRSSFHSTTCPFPVSFYSSETW
jgi:predicted nucleotidyltransferase